MAEEAHHFYIAVVSCVDGFICSVDGFTCSAGGFACSADGSIHSIEGFLCSGGGSTCSVEGFLCFGGGLVCSVDGLVYFADDLVCSADGFIYSVEARNWWVDGSSSIRAANITFGQASPTYAEPAFCCRGAKLTVAGPGRHSHLTNFVTD